MKTIIQHITERLQLNKDRIFKYQYTPKTTEELEDIIYEITNEHKHDKIIDLNMIDTSKITSMSELFSENEHNYDISNWDVSNVKDMSEMFFNSAFNNDISQWDVSNVKNMSGMFYGSDFNQNISDWDVSKVVNIEFIFEHSKFNKDLSAWKSKIKDKDQLQYIQDYI